jgi:hypothetical protein
MADPKSADVELTPTPTQAEMDAMITGQMHIDDKESGVPKTTPERARPAPEPQATRRSS